VLQLPNIGEDDELQLLLQMWEKEQKSKEKKNRVEEHISFLSTPTDVSEALNLRSKGH